MSSGRRAKKSSDRVSIADFLTSQLNSCLDGKCMQATKESNQSETTTSLELVTLKPLRMFERRLMSSSVILASFANPKDASMYLSSSFSAACSAPQSSAQAGPPSQRSR